MRSDVNKDKKTKGKKRKERNGECLPIAPWSRGEAGGCQFKSASRRRARYVYMTGSELGLVTSKHLGLVVVCGHTGRTGHVMHVDGSSVIIGREGGRARRVSWDVISRRPRSTTSGLLLPSESRAGGRQEAAQIRTHLAVFLFFGSRLAKPGFDMVTLKFCNFSFSFPFFFSFFFPSLSFSLRFIEAMVIRVKKVAFLSGLANSLYSLAVFMHLSSDDGKQRRMAGVEGGDIGGAVCFLSAAWS